MRHGPQSTAQEQTRQIDEAQSEDKRMTATLRRARLILIAAGLVSLALGAQSALAASPWWLLRSMDRPAQLPSQPGETGEIAVVAEDVGDVAANASTGDAPVVLHDILPGGLEAVAIGASSPGFQDPPNRPDGPTSCSLAQLSCRFAKELAPFTQLEIRIRVKVKEGAHSGERNRVEVTGGGAPSASASAAVSYGTGTGRFGVESFSTRFEEEGGAPDTQAGSHPFQLTTTVTLNQGPDEETAENGAHKPTVTPIGLAKDVFTKFPVGFIGDPTPVPTCSILQFLRFIVTAPAGQNQEENLCPAQTAVGVASVTIYEPLILSYSTFTVPLFNLEPEFGEPARFGFAIPLGDAPVVLDASLRSEAGEGAVPGQSEDYGINVDATNITQTAALINATVTVWGTPGDPRHNTSRGWSCIYETTGEDHAPCVHSEEKHPPAFLTVPTSCAGPMQASVEADSWGKPGAFEDVLPSESMPTLVGCNRLPFGPTVQATPTTTSASSPTGLDVNLDFHDEGLISSEGLTQSRLKDTTVTLPEGLTVNPSSGVGLAGCRPEQYRRETLSSTSGAGCPDESKLGTVEIVTPVLNSPIHGGLFIAQPYENPFGSLLALYIVARNPETGIFIKLAGKVTPNLVTGQLVTTFENAPQLPFSHFNFHFREGAQAPLITPPACGTYTTKAVLTPWANPFAPLTVDSSFTVTSGVGGGLCPSGGVPPFVPGIQSGMQNNNAGAFSPFYLHLTRTDAEQYISGFSTSLPPGLTGNLSGIPFCSEAAIEAARHKTGKQEEAEPSCPAASQIGHTLVGTGVGAVLAYVPGKIYLAGPFHGAPFSLVAVTSAVVGPFDLGTVVLRFGLNIDPYTAQVSVSPASSEPIPTIIDGIVTHVRDIRVYIERPGNAPFTLNPTSCNPTAIGSTLNSPGGASATVSSPFQAASCASLKFAPKFVVSTSGKTSKADGASLHVLLTYPSAPQGTYANIAKVKVELPKQLPSRLTTLQKACTSAQFEANPAGCPGPSAIGTAKAVVPNIPEPLVGPVYFVSHGGEAFPSLEVVLQGYGVKVVLVGSTFISKAGITSTTFKTVPDNPVSSFELTLPEGKYSALAANGNLCGQKLKMPSDFTGQNGMEADYKTVVSVTGCAKAKVLTRAQKLKAALKACRKDRSKAKRAKCETAARKKYGPAKAKAKKKAKKSGTKR
jgi:hypothetical protein